MPIYDLGTLNLSALNIADAYIGIVPPQPLINGAASDVVAFVGTASSGPVNKAVIIGDTASYRQVFGPVQNRKFDLGTACALASLQGGTNQRHVRVTDGTDTAATAVLAAGEETNAPVFYAALAAAVNTGAGVLRNASNLITFDLVNGKFVAFYTGTFGNNTNVTITNGSRTGTYAVIVNNGTTNERFDNLPATVGHLPTVGNTVLAGGTDGAAGVTAATLVGDSSLMTGMYALHGQRMASFVLVDCDDSTQWSVQIDFARAETCFAVVAGPSGDTVSAAITRKRSAGIDHWRIWVLHGDYLFWSDQTNGIIRKVSPAAIVAGLSVALSPENSPLNKELTGILGSEYCGLVGSGSTATYSRAQLASLFDAGIDLVTNPAPGGAYWAVRNGHNSSSEAVQSGVAYTTMTNFVARSLNEVMGKYVGLPISTTRVNQANAELNAFFANLYGLDMIGGLDGVQPWRVVCDKTNNPQSRTGVGYLKASCECRYLGIIEKFIIDLQGGASVVIGG